MEKMKFKIMANDPLYGRLLKLELEGMGLEEAAEGAHDYHVLAAEGLLELPTQRRLRAAIFVDCGLLSVAMPDQVKILLLGKPFLVTELREFIGEVMESTDDGEYAEKELVISEEDLSVSYRNTVVKLTPREFALLAYLHARPGQTVTRAELLTNLWQDEKVRDTNVVDVYVRFLRSKLDEPLGLRLIRAVRGEGYVYAYESRGV